MIWPALRSITETKCVDSSREASILPAGRFSSLPFAFAVLFFAVLFWLDYPKPHMEDLFFVGTPIHMVQGGDFSNPLLARQLYPSHFYFVHPPAFSFILAGWLKIFGVSTAALLGFQWLMYVLICGATSIILRQHQSPGWLEWLLPLAVAAAFLPEGLRPESLAVALTMGGWALLELVNVRRAGVFVGFCLMILGASVASRISFICGALVVAALVQLRQKITPFSRVLVLAAAALLLVLVALSTMIGFRYLEFWQTYHFTAAGRVGGNRIAALWHFFESLSIIQRPLVLLGLATAPLIVVWRSHRLMHINFYLIAAMLVTAGLGALGHGGLWFFILMLLFTCVTGMKIFRSRFAVLLPLLLTGGLLLASSRIMIYATGILCNAIKADKGGDPHTVQALRSTSEHPVLIDSQTARYLFDYRIPAGFLDWSFSAPFPKALATDEALRPGDVYLIGPDSMEGFNVKFHLNLTIPKWDPFRSTKKFHVYPHRYYYLRAEDVSDLNSRINSPVRAAVPVEGK